LIATAEGNEPDNVRECSGRIVDDAHDAGRIVIGLTLSVVALNIVLRGLRIQPLLERYERYTPSVAGDR
jgi:hypothetical protein